MSVEFNMVITNEGVDLAREASVNANWHLIPKRYAISETAGELSENRSYTDMHATWTTQLMSSSKNGSDAIQNSVIIKGNASSVDKKIGEIYFIYTNESNEEFLFAIAQPVIGDGTQDLMFTPGVQQNYLFLFRLNNTNVSDIVQINYSFEEDIDNHANDEHAHPNLLARDGSRTATNIIKYEAAYDFQNPLDIVNKAYVDAQLGEVTDYVNVTVPTAVPIGSIMIWGGIKTSAIVTAFNKSGLYFCDGTSPTFNGNDTKYRELWNAIGSTYGGSISAIKIPNFSGCFLRGLGGNAGALGVRQEDAIYFKSASGWFNGMRGYNSYADGTLFTEGGVVNGDTGRRNPEWYNNTVRINMNLNTSTRVANETRPRNYAIHYLMKVANPVEESTPSTETFTFTVIPNPSDAIVKINGSVQSSLTNLNNGDSVSWEVSKTGYITKSNTETVTGNINRSVTLETVPTYTFTIKPNPTDATVTINGANRTSVTGLTSGTTVTWSVSKSGYTTQSGSQTISSDITKTITLVAQPSARYLAYTNYSYFGSATYYAMHWLGFVKTPCHVGDSIYLYGTNVNGTYVALDYTKNTPTIDTDHIWKTADGRDFITIEYNPAMQQWSGAIKVTAVDENGYPTIASLKTNNDKTFNWTRASKYDIN